MKHIAFSMRRGIAVVWISTILLLSSFVLIHELSDHIAEVKGAIYYVNETGSFGAFSSIQDAINASSDGDTILVYEGIYHENVLVNKRVSLIGSGSETTIIDGGWKDHQNVVTIITNGVNMSGFGMINSYMGHEFGGIGVYSSDNTISDNHCWSNLYGCILFAGPNRVCNNSFSDNERDGIFVKSSGNVIENNTCSNSFDRDGIWLYICTDNIVSNNTCSGNSKNGISLYQSHNNILFNNKCNNSTLYDGLLIYQSSNNTLWNNTLSSNNRGGFVLSHFSDNNTLFNNILTGSNVGVDIHDNCSINTVRSNNLIENTAYGFYMSDSPGNRIYHNNVIDNAVQAYDDRSDNYWDDGYPSGGNYWSDYGGIDMNSTPAQDAPPPDGLGDTPYEIDPDSADNYPLISPFGNLALLYEGWNLISIPLIQSDTSLDACLSSITGSYDAVQWFDAGFGSWKHTHPSKPFHLNDLSEIEHTIGFWIHITEPGGVLFEYSGIQPTSNQSISLSFGWNMVGYPSLTRNNMTNGLNNISFGTDVDCIHWYDAADKTWHFMGPDDYFIPGRGYWVHAKVEATWEVPL